MTDTAAATRTNRRYFLSRDAETIARFLAAHATWLRKINVYTMETERGAEAEFPKGRPSEKAKWGAYDAAARIVRLLDLERADHDAHDVPGLARVYGLALAAYIEV